MSSAIVKLIEQRKKTNAYYDKMNATIAEGKKLEQLAQFEISTSKKIEKRQKDKRFEELRRQQEASLIERRHQLADLYNSEIEAWRNEVLASVETQEDRKRNIMERAYALRDRREKSRADYVKTALDAQWRDACDDARTLDSVAMLQFVKDERLAQIEEKKRRKERLSVAENDFYNAWQQHLAEYDRKEHEKLAKRESDQKSTLDSITGQIVLSKHIKEENKRKQLEDDSEEIKNIRRSIAEEEALNRAKLLQAKKLGKDVQILNTQVKAIKLEEDRIRKVQDNMLLDYAMEQERKAAEEEEAKRNANRKAAQEYRKYLEIQMQKEAEDTAFVDEMRKREEDKVFKQREDALNARKAARDHLMRQVDEGRRQQISHKEKEHLAQKEEEARWASKFIEDAEIALQREREAAAARRRVAEDNNARLLEQISQRQEYEELEKQEKYLSDKHMQHIERAHRQKLAEQGGTVRNFRPIKKSQWYT